MVYPKGGVLAEKWAKVSIPNQEDHGFHPWVNWSSGTGCSPLVGVCQEPRALPAGLHRYSKEVSVFRGRMRGAMKHRIRERYR